MQSVLGSHDSETYKKMLQTIKDEQRILKLEELIDNERILQKELELEAKLILGKIDKLKKRKREKYRNTSLQTYYQDNDFKEKAYIRNTLTSTIYN